MKKEKIKVWIVLILLIVCIGVAAGYFLKAHKETTDISSLSVKMSLLDLYDQNSDIVGWIRIPETSVSYPVMNSADYLHKDINKEYEYRGTPFVLNEWTTESRNSMIYGHNMWVEKTMFNPIHKFEKKEYWEKHRIAEFFVVRTDREEPYVEKRTYAIHAADLVNINGKVYQSAEFFDEDGTGSLRDLFDTANSERLYDTSVDWTGGDELTLCTCSYHISGNRDAGRILLFGTRIETEEKDICD